MEHARPDLAERLRLLLVTDRRRTPGSLSDAVARAVAGGATAVMLRERDLTTDELVRIGRPVGEVCRAGGALFLVNGDLDAAQALGADGVHLGYGAPPPAEARRRLGPRAAVGASTHDARELAERLAEGIDYVTFGPVHDSPKPAHERAPRGLDGLRAAVEQAGTTPVVALGGIGPTNTGAIRGTGAAGVAGIRCFLRPEGPRAAAQALRAAWRGIA